MIRFSHAVSTLALVALLSASTLNARADSLTADTPFIRVSFSGEISASRMEFLPPTITPQVGDPFQLTLTFWRTDAPYAKTVGSFPDYTARGAYSEQLLINGTPYFGGQNFASFDTISSLSLSDGTLSFVATDQGAGARGSLLVGNDFPTAWFADIRSPLPNNATHTDFGGTGVLDYFYGLRLPAISGNISGGSVEVWGGVQSAGSLPVPEVTSLALLVPVSLMLLRRRRIPALHPN